MGDILKFRDKVQMADYADLLVDLGNSARGNIAGGLTIVVTKDGGVQVICGPDLDSAMSTLSKLQAILGSVYTNNLAAQ